MEEIWIAFVPILLSLGLLILLNFRLLYWFLLISIPLSFTFDFSKSLSTDFPTEFISIVITGIFWILYLKNRPESLKSLWNSKLFWALCLLLFWSFITSLFAVNKLIAFKFSAAKIWYITAYLIMTYWMIRSELELKKIFWFIYIPTLITVIYSFMNTWIGDFNFENTNKFSLPFYDNHVLYASIMSIMVPLVIQARKWYLRGSLIRLGLGASIILLIVAIYFSYTRACYLALIVGLIVSVLIKWRKILTAYILTIILTLSVLFYFSKDYFYLQLAPDYNTTVMHNEFKDHLISTFYGKDVSSMERLNMWVSVFRMYQERPFIGYGPNNFPSSYKPYGVLYFKTWVSDNPLNLSCHNYFWLLLAEQGVIGCLLFVFFVGFALYYAQLVYHTSADKFTKNLALAIGSSLGILIVILFFNDLIETSKIGSIFFILIAILCKLNSWTTESEKRSIS
jgi:O-antigen ligase